MESKVDVTPMCHELKEFVEFIKPGTKICMQTVVAILNYNTVTKIEKVFGFKLYPWQKKYLFSDNNIPADIQKKRDNGKTFIEIVKYILSKQYEDVLWVTPLWSVPTRQRYHRLMFHNIYNKLNAGGFKLPKIEYGPPRHHK